jgi:hypothetical protein
MGLLRGKLDYDSKEDETYDVQDDEKKKWNSNEEDSDRSSVS